MADHKPRPDDGATPPSPESAPPDMAAQHLRRDIDTGRTGDKIAAEDPAAAPLGTDAEAAGMTGAEAPPPSTPNPNAPHKSPRYPEGHQKGSEIGPGKGLGVAVASLVAVVLAVLAMVMVAT